MKSLYLDPETNDLVITDKMGLETVSGVDEAAQHLRILLTTRLGEWFLNTQYGFEYDAILGQRLSCHIRYRASNSMLFPLRETLP